jgi:hypothetical protein
MQETDVPWYKVNPVKAVAATRAAPYLGAARTGRVDIVLTAPISQLSGCNLGTRKWVDLLDEREAARRPKKSV